MKKLKKYIPVPSFIFFGIGLISLGINIAYLLNVNFADKFNSTLAAYFRRGMAYLTCLVPFSVTEMIVIMLPAIIFFIFFGVIAYSEKRKENFIRAVIFLISVIVLIYSMFVFSIGAGYRTTTLDEKLGMDGHEISAQELYDTLCIVIDELNEAAEDLETYQGIGTVMPYTVSECSRLCSDSYDILSSQYDFIDSFDVGVKRIALSQLMTYTHISGIYTFYTGEANINTNYPYFVVAFTTAHEMAHQRGISRENEANFVAFLVCINSEDEYLKYSGYLNMYEYLADALYKASPNKYAKARMLLADTPKYDLKCYSAFFDKYRENTAADVTETVNNTYLTSQGTIGTASYGLVVDLAVQYYKNQK